MGYAWNDYRPRSRFNRKGCAYASAWIFGILGFNVLLLLFINWSIDAYNQPDRTFTQRDATLPANVSVIDFTNASTIHRSSCGQHGQTCSSTAQLPSQIFWAYSSNGKTSIISCQADEDHINMLTRSHDCSLFPAPSSMAAATLLGVNENYFGDAVTVWQPQSGPLQACVNSRDWNTNTISPITPPCQSYIPPSDLPAGSVLQSLNDGEKGLVVPQTLWETPQKTWEICNHDSGDETDPIPQFGPVPTGSCTPFSLPYSLFPQPKDRLEHNESIASINSVHITSDHGTPSQLLIQATLQDESKVLIHCQYDDTSTDSGAKYFEDGGAEWCNWFPSVAQSDLSQSMAA